MVKWRRRDLEHCRGRGLGRHLSWRARRVAHLGYRTKGRLLLWRSNHQTSQDPSTQGLVFAVQTNRPAKAASPIKWHNSAQTLSKLSIEHRRRE